MQALQARRHPAAVRNGRLGILIEIRCCAAHKRIAGNEKDDEWAKIAAEEPANLGVEWPSYSDRAEARAMPLPRSRLHIKWEIFIQKWA